MAIYEIGNEINMYKNSVEYNQKTSGEDRRTDFSGLESKTPAYGSWQGLD
jgi:hypothetical protein